MSEMLELRRGQLDELLVGFVQREVELVLLRYMAGTH